ncbi:sulfatase-like hydrolase/transferase [uncultured Sphaerochaeta sp.]|uniref:sulfatase family protein n=1 Tax=uncultured Sphaerochaeta sp. TaxID=886478 RepID=UPI002A0A6075|nr:sulfatase-like hydrolase/transferase [uncultured Sphaerochaeta sp.]
MNKSPNLVLFLSDDHGAWASGCYGDPYLQTPNIDFLAENGVQMLNAFTPTPVCSPARACLMTGRLASQHGVHDYIGTTKGFDVDYNWMEKETLLPELFQQAGYETILVGKWHLGQERIRKQGFDHAFTIGPDYPILHQGERTFYRDDVPVSTNGVLSETITEEAVWYLRTRTNDKPFLLVIGHYATHSPWLGHPEPLVEYYQKKGVGKNLFAYQYPFGTLVNEATDVTREQPALALCQYYAGVTEIDNSVGKILHELNNLGLQENTMVAYTSDHGLNCGQHGLWGKGNATYPLNMLEQSIRIPMIFYYPKRLLNKQKREEFVDHTDLFATLLDLASIAESPEAIKKRNSPGKSFLSLLTNTYAKKEIKRLQFGEYGPVRMVRTHRYKLCMYPDQADNLLFDLQEDPGERINVIDEQPYQEIISSLKDLINSFFTIYQEPGKQGNHPHLPQFNPHVAWNHFKEN